MVVDPLNPGVAGVLNLVLATEAPPEEAGVHNVVVDLPAAPQEGRVSARAVDENRRPQFRHPWVRRVTPHGAGRLRWIGACPQPQLGQRTARCSGSSGLAGAGALLVVGVAMTTMVSAAAGRRLRVARSGARIIVPYLERKSETCRIWGWRKGLEGFTLPNMGASANTTTVASVVSLDQAARLRRLAAALGVSPSATLAALIPDEAALDALVLDAQHRGGGAGALRAALSGAVAAGFAAGKLAATMPDEAWSDRVKVAGLLAWASMNPEEALGYYTEWVRELRESQSRSARETILEPSAREREIAAMAPGDLLDELDREGLSRNRRRELVNSFFISVGRRSDTYAQERIGELLSIGDALIDNAPDAIVAARAWIVDNILTEKTQEN